MTSSTIEANTIQNTASKLILGSTGSVLQSVFSTPLNSGRTGSVSTTVADWVTTGISATITPISASSKLYVRFTGSMYFFGPGAGDDGVACRVYRDGTPISPSTDMLF